jgi:putative transposase
MVRDIEGIAIEIGGVSDHSHILARLKAKYSISDSLRIIKSGSSKWVHESIGVRSSDVEVIRKYIRNQREHHRKKTFQEEYIELLNENGIEFDEKHLWQRVVRPSRGLFGRHSTFPGLRAALRRSTPGYCSIGASGA